MKKIFTLLLLGGLLFVGAGNVLATDVKIYYAVDKDVVGNQIVKFKANRDGDGWLGPITMTKLSKQYNSTYNVYEGTFSTDKEYLWEIQFQVYYANDTWHWEENSLNNNKTSNNSIANRMFVNGGSWEDTYILHGTWGENGAWDSELIFDGVTRTFGAGETYEFKVEKNIEASWYGNTGTMTWYNCSGWNFEQDKSNCTIVTNFAGNYTFTNAGTSISVSYPTQTYTAYFEKPSDWSQVKAHIWRYEDSANRNITDWPGQVITTTEGNYYKATFTSPAEPTGIIWNKHDGTDAGIVGTDQTSNLTFEENAIYWFANNGEIIPSFTVYFTPDGYATFHYPTDNVLLPSGVTACSVGYSAPTLPLTDFSGDNSNVIPADLPVILKGSGSATLYATKNTAFASGSSVLTGSGNSGASGGEGIYVLGIQGESTSGTAFYRYPSGTIPANRAYLNTGGKYAPDAIRIVEGENNTTNLENVETNNNSVKFIKNGQLYIMRNGVVYDVMGRIAE